jgi:hypothetical protein
MALQRMSWMWRAFPVYPVLTSARLGIAKYRWSAVLMRIRPLNLVPASVDQTQARVLKVGTHEMPERPSDDCPRTTDVHAMLRRRPDSFQWAVSEMWVEDNGLEIAQALPQPLFVLRVETTDLTFRAVKATAVALARESAWLCLQLTSFVKIVSSIHTPIVLSLLECLSDIRWLGSQLPFLGLVDMHPALAEQQHASRYHSSH